MFWSDTDLFLDFSNVCLRLLVPLFFSRKCLNDDVLLRHVLSLILATASVVAFLSFSITRKFANFPLRSNVDAFFGQIVPGFLISLSVWIPAVPKSVLVKGRTLSCSLFGRLSVHPGCIKVVEYLGFIWNSLSTFVSW